MRMFYVRIFWGQHAAKSSPHPLRGWRGEATSLVLFFAAIPDISTAPRRRRRVTEKGSGRYGRDITPV